MSVAEEEDLRERERERAQQQARIYEKQCERTKMASSTLSVNAKVLFNHHSFFFPFSTRLSLAEKVVQKICAQPLSPLNAGLVAL